MKRMLDPTKIVGEVKSVNGQKGEVELKASDIKATNSQTIQQNLERIDTRIDEFNGSPYKLIKVVSVPESTLKITDIVHLPEDYSFVEVHIIVSGYSAYDFILKLHLSVNSKIAVLYGWDIKNIKAGKSIELNLDATLSDLSNAMTNLIPEEV